MVSGQLVWSTTLTVGSGGLTFFHPHPCVFALRDTGGGVLDWLLHDEVNCGFCSMRLARSRTILNDGARSRVLVTGSSEFDSMCGCRVVLCLCDLLPSVCPRAHTSSEATDVGYSWGVSCPDRSRILFGCESCHGIDWAASGDVHYPVFEMSPSCLQKVRLCMDPGDTFAVLAGPWFPDLLVDSSLVHPLHPCARAWLNTLPCLTSGDHKLFHLYVDGSGLSDTGHSPAWGLAVFGGQCIEDMQFIGFAGGKVVTDMYSSAYVGACSADSISAELSASVWAMLYIMASVPEGATCEVLYDSVYAAGASTASARISAHTEFCRISAALFHLVSLRCHVFSACEVSCLAAWQ